MHKPFTLLFLLPGLILLHPKAFGQELQPTPAAPAPSVRAATDHYHQALGGQRHVFTGSEYVDDALPRRGHPYYKTREWENADIFFDGLLYRDIPILYDLVGDHVLLSVSDEAGLFHKIKLLPDKIGYFVFQGDTFVRKEAGEALVPGLYHRLYGGQVEVLAKRQKKRNDRIEERSVISVFTPKDRYFIRKDGRYYPVKSKASVLRVFQDQKKELARDLRQSGINYQQHREEALIRLAQQYETLRN